MRKCVVKSCRSTRSFNCKLISFPTNFNERQIWIRKCGLKREQIIKYMFICDKHFSGKCKPMKGATPSLNLSSAPLPALKFRYEKCILQHCQQKHSSVLKLFRFPKKGSELCKKWIDICKIPEPENCYRTFLCSSHFKSADIGKRQLKKNVTPSLKLNVDCSSASDLSDLLIQHPVDPLLPPKNISDENMYCDFDIASDIMQPSVRVQNLVRVLALFA